MGKIKLTSWAGTAQGEVEVIKSDDGKYSLKIIGRKNEEYEFTLTDEAETDFTFEYYYDKESSSFVLNKKEY